MARQHFDRVNCRSWMCQRKRARPSKLDAPFSFSGLNSGPCQIVGGGFSGPFVLDDLIGDLLALIEAVQPRTLDGGNVDEYVRPAFVRLNEAISLLTIEPFYGASCHDARSLV